MTDRVLIVRSSDGSSVTRKVTGGVPQGSVLGPILWNLFYDSLLNMRVPEGVQLVGFADDLAVLAVARTTTGLERSINLTLAAINDWTEQHGLKLAHHK